MKTLLIVAAAVTALGTAVIAGDSTDVKTKVDSVDVKKAPDSSEVKGKELKFITTESGLQYADLVVGEGVVATDKMHVECHYALWIADEKGEKGKHIQSSKDSGSAFKCQIGVGLIPGWSEGMTGMKEGGKRMLIIPPEIGYGNKAMGPMPPNSTLIFEIEFIKSLDK